MIPDPATLPRPRFFWPGLMVALPLLVLALLAAAGLRSRWQARLSEAQEEAQRLVDRTGRDLDRLMAEAPGRLRPVQLYPSPPEPPAEPSAAWREASASKNPDAFLQLRDAPEPAWTDAGLPVAALAAWQMFSLDPSPSNASALVEIITGRWPSVVSPVILDKSLELAGNRPALMEILSAGRETWQGDEDLRALVQRHPAGPETSKWIVDQGALWLIRNQEGKTAVANLTPSLEQQIRPTPDSGFPAWLSLSLWRNGQSISPGESSPQTGQRILAEYRGDVNLRASVSDPDRLYAPLRTEILWVAGVIGAAILAAGGGLHFSRRALLREQRLHALKSQFVASVSHELRAPIGSVRLMSEALASGTVKGEAADSFYRLLAQEGVRLSALIENILDFARIEAGHKAYQKSETDIDALLRDTIALLEPKAAARSITLHLETEPPAKVPEVDALALQQAVLNLLDNALKFSPDQSVISIQLADQGSRGWSISVADQGPGIPPAEHSRIFERFHRLGNELRRETQGAGIGLSLVKHITEGHGGKVTVQNLTPHGCQFTLHFPRNPLNPET